MDKPDRPSVAEKLADKPRIEAALRRAGREALLMHARAGNPVSTWKDGKVVWLQPAEVLALLANGENGQDEPNGEPGA
jgi:hypothetical protein